jgi:hypothetical protein
MDWAMPRIHQNARLKEDTCDIAEATWLLSRDQDVSALGDLIYHLDRHKAQYTVKFLCDDQ